MKPLVDLSKASAADVRINLGGRDIGMPEHHLQRAEVRPMLQEMGRKGVTNGVGSDAPVDPGLCPVHPDGFPESLARQAAAPASDKEERGISCSH